MGQLWFKVPLYCPGVAQVFKHQLWHNLLYLFFVVFFTLACKTQLQKAKLADCPTSPGLIWNLCEILQSNRTWDGRKP